MRLQLAVPALLFLGFLRCGSAGDAGDAGPDAVYGHKPLDSGTPPPDAAEAKTPWNRMTAHNGVVLGAPHLYVVYIGTQAVDLSPSYDGYIGWMVQTTDWWSIMAQYGVDYGALDGSTVIDTATFFPPGMINNGFVNWFALDQRVQQIIHGTQAGDAGASDASDDGGDAGDAAPSTLPIIPKADAYIFFLPDGVNVDLGAEGATCAGVGGYHSYDGQEPYAIIPPCRYKVAVSHEIAEMVTDPEPGQGWFSDGDVQNAGGEIGDICNFVTFVNNQAVTALWSNKDGDCEPP